MTQRVTQNAQRFRGKGDIALAAGVVLILGLMLIPLPTIILDLMLSFSISLSFLVLLTSMFMISPLEFSIFPTLLLVTTLLRLGLNVASTRLILLNGDKGASAAGEIIQSFAEFVVGGSYVVGAVIFLILFILNKVVITSGTTRIAEVAARFTLDAMPGKQMAIEADLNSGLITEEEAVQQRKNIRREADFYGAMDGAGKFVQGERDCRHVHYFHQYHWRGNHRCCAVRHEFSRRFANLCPADHRRRLGFHNSFHHYFGFSRYHRVPRRSRKQNGRRIFNAADI